MLFTHELVNLKKSYPIHAFIHLCLLLFFSFISFSTVNIQTQFTVHFAKLIDLSNLPILSAFQYVHTFFCNLITDVHFFSSKPPYFLSISPGCRVKFFIKISLRMQITKKNTKISHDFLKEWMILQQEPTNLPNWLLFEIHLVLKGIHLS